MEEETKTFNSMKICESEEISKYCLFKKIFKKKKMDLRGNNFILPCIAHLQKYHPDKYFIDFADFELDLTECRQHYFILRQMNVLYFVELDIRNDFIYTQVHNLVLDYTKFRRKQFTIEFTNERTILKSGTVRKLGSSDTLKLIVSDLENIIGNVTNVKVRIDIELDFDSCECGQVLSGLNAMLIINKGWRCSKCAKIPRQCNSNYYGCNFEDIPAKLKKHSLFFCPHRNICYICRKNIRDIHPIPHYRQTHTDITHPTETDFKVMETNGAYLLLSNDEELFLCRYHLQHNEFSMTIRSPWQRRQIEEYCCVVTMTPVLQNKRLNNESKTFKMQTLLEDFEDWRFDVKSWVFHTWSTEFIISVKFIKIS